MKNYLLVLFVACLAMCCISCSSKREKACKECETTIDTAVVVKTGKIVDLGLSATTLLLDNGYTITLQDARHPEVCFLAPKDTIIYKITTDYKHICDVERLKYYKAPATE